MTPRPSAASRQQIRTLPPEAPHRHDEACFWDIDDCRWQCVTRPLLGSTRERRA